MKFAHMADVHIGAWREPKLSELNAQAFVKAVDLCIEEKVDFILICGDLFNTSLPPIEKLKIAVIKLRQLKDEGIPVYAIPGSHDFSPSGKTMLDVLEGAGLCINTAKGRVVSDKLSLRFTIDKKTGAKITGIIGRKGMLEVAYLEQMDRTALEKESGFKIFMFHTAITELKPKEMENMQSLPASLLPKGFDYYAGGHVHITKHESIEGYRNIVYPGPLFPNTFKEMEDYNDCGFYIFQDGEISKREIRVVNVSSIHIDCNRKSPEEIESVTQSLKGKEFYNTIVTLRFTGVLKSGKISDINFGKIMEAFYERGAVFVMKNTGGLLTKDFEDIKTESSENIAELEARLVREHLGQLKLNGVSLEQEEALIKSLLSISAAERQEGEKLYDFHARVCKDIDLVLEPILK
ncbi:MAG: DNA repair exonuclease [Candidatus Woesearchaeota archaeon]